MLGQVGILTKSLGYILRIRKQDSLDTIAQGSEGLLKIFWRKQTENNTGVRRAKETLYMTPSMV